jgi:TfoX/Sxy family transcriptional regulator of competence genes
MKWEKSPGELIKFLAEITKDINCQPRKMFGYPAYFINNNMFLCAFQENLVIRLSEKDKAKVLKQYKDVREFEPMPGRAMREYVAIPESLYRDKTAFPEILNMSLKYVSNLPPKVKGKKSKN